ncbi:MAG: glycoside hydrolase family 3 N-terminal domain-containing protein [Aeromicrobium sp.]
MRHARETRSRRPALVAAVAALVIGSAVTATALDRSARSEPAPVTSAPAPAPSTPAEPVGWGPTEEERAEAAQKAKDLTLKELAGQLIVARHFDNESSLALIRDRHFAGAMVTGNRILDVTTSDPLATVTDFNDQMQAAGSERGVPVMIPIDQEGGLVARLAAPLTPFPTFMSAGAAIAGDSTSGAAAVTAAARASGAELRAAGFNTVFAPTSDITIGVDDPIIGSRSAGTDPQTVARAVVAAVDGYSEAGIISVAKHFPGHNVSTDSHKGLPILDSEENRFRNHDLVPFEAAIDVRVPGIMTGHLDVPLLDKGVPASMSRQVITTELRERMDFDGLVVSDSLGMGAVMKSYPGGKAAVEAVKAGSDVALMPADNLQAHDAMLEALRSGDLPEAQARASAARTIAYLLHADASRELPGEPGSHLEEAVGLSAAAVTVVAEPCEDVPEPTSFRPIGSPDLVAAFVAAAKASDTSIGSGPVVQLLGNTTAGGSADIVVTTDRPYPLQNSRAATKIALFGAGPPAMRALIDVLTGSTPAGGRLPVDGIDVQTCDS